MSEFRRLLDTLKMLGIEHRINWRCEKKEWQDIILEAGHNFTSLACTAVEINGTQLLFLNEGGLYILSRNMTSGKVETHKRMNMNGDRIGGDRIIYLTDPNQRVEELQLVDSRAK